MKILIVRFLEQVSVRVLPGFDGVALSVCPVFVHEDTLTLGVLGGLLVSLIANGLYRPQYCRRGEV